MSQRSRSASLVLTALAALGNGVGAQDHELRGVATPTTPPLYDDLGAYHAPITTAEPLVQRYFDQGLRLYYAFNHAEAIRSFRAAQELEPGCAMCWWGEALAWGPNINLPMDSASAVAAYIAVQRALELRPRASERERSLIDALGARYAQMPRGDRAYLDQAYAEAMGTLAARYPDDPEVRVLHAESLMDLRPWDYWTEEGDPAPGIADALAGLEHVRERDPDHPGACHFFIHAVEKLFPERAVPCAERLAGLMPGAGHLVHMPGHIYIRVGRYLDAVEANQHAIHADETYIQDQRPDMGAYTAGYYPHNYDFLAFASMMIGRSEDAIGAAEKVSTLIPTEMFGVPGMDFLQHWSSRPLLVRSRFGRWSELLEAPAPPSDRPHARAMWHYARGRALAATGDVPGARAELESLRSIAVGPALDALRMEFNPSRDLVAIAERVLTGRMASAAGRHDEAVQALTDAVRLEDGLLYGEPPEWTVPTRQDLGEVLLEAGRPAEAETAFREDLERFPMNGWSLHGLSVALRAQGNEAEAATVESQLGRVWETADVDVDGLRRR
jgi:tetratricopeptide (TPR) repeat protein